MLLLAAASPAAEQAPQASRVDVYQGPKGIDVTLPTYPIGERQSRAEGWVIVNFMVDQQGKPYEVSVADSTGNRVLESAAAEQAAKWQAAIAQDPVRNLERSALLDGIGRPAGHEVPADPVVRSAT
jgi:TonB family protein